MFRLNNIKQNILIVAIAALLTGCGGGGSNTSTTTDSTIATLKVVTVQINETMITEDSATIEWIPFADTTILVEYGTSKKYGSEVLVQEEGTVTLYNLQPNTTYYYKIVAEDQNGRQVVSKGDDFTTLAASTQPAVTDPAPTEPTVTEPIVTEPAPTEPAPTEPIVTEPAPTEPIPVESNNPPEAQEVKIVGTPKTGETLTLEYTFIDVDGDIEGDSIIAWSTPTVEVQRGTSKTFTIPAELAGAELSAWVHLSDGKVLNVQGIQAANGYITIEPATPIVEPTPEPAPTSTANAIHQGQVKDSSTGIGLADVKVTIGGSTTTTDADGFYTLSDLNVSEEVVVNFEKVGYLIGSTQIQLKSLSGDNTPSSNYLEYDMYVHDYQYDLESSEAISSPRINIDASVSYIDAEGYPYNGTMALKLTILDNDEDALLANFPGAFKGINSNGTLVQFDTYGLINISLYDSNGKELSFADGETGTLVFKEITSLDKPATLPLWYYDYEQGLWVEEGYAELQADGTYRGEITDLGTWSLNRALIDEPGIYRGRILNEDGTPASDVRVNAIGNNWISKDLSTDVDGMFEIEVIPDSSFQLTAYNYKDKYEAIYNGTIPAIASGDIVEN